MCRYGALGGARLATFCTRVRCAEVERRSEVMCARCRTIGLCHEGLMRWADLEREAPLLASRVRERLIDTGVLLVATVRRDGTPRLSPVEPLVLDGDPVALASSTVGRLTKRRSETVQCPVPPANSKKKCRSAPSSRPVQAAIGGALWRVPDLPICPRLEGCLPRLMPAGGELGETGTSDFSDVGRCSRW
jgi:hypothetical protein